MDNKFVKIARLGRETIEAGSVYEASEKLDGANFSYYVNTDGELVCSSRNQELTGRLGNFSRCIEYVTAKHIEHPFEQGVLYFGECMTKHTIHYGETPYFVGFAVLEIDTGDYIPDWEAYFSSHGMTTVETVCICGTSVEEYINNNLDSKSNYGDTGAIQEGIVLKCYDTQQFVKFVRDAFKEDNRKVFGGSLIPSCDTSTIVSRFCTHGRIEKSVLSLRDESGIEVSIRMMVNVPTMVCDDIIAEEAMVIYKKYDEINFRRFRKLVAAECVRYFKSLDQQHLQTL